MDIIKGVMAVKMPLLAWIGLTIVLNIISMIPGLNMVLCAVGPLLFLAGLLIPIYIGYLLAGQKYELVETGIIVAIASVINSIIGSILGLIGMTVGLTTGAMGGSANSAALGIGFALVGMVIGIVLAVILGFVLGVVGHFVYGLMSKKQEKPEKSEKAKK